MCPAAAGVELNPEMGTALLNCYRNARTPGRQPAWSQAEAVLSRMQASTGAAPNVRTYNSLMGMYVENEGPVERLAQLQAALLDQGIRPTEVNKADFEGTSRMAAPGVKGVVIDIGRKGAGRRRTVATNRRCCHHAYAICACGLHGCR